MSSKYRDNAFTLNQIRDTIILASPETVDIFIVCSWANEVNSKEQLNVFLDNWREAYSDLTRVIKIGKKSRTNGEDQSSYQIGLASLKKLANTMMNARQVAFDRYNSRKEVVNG